MAEWLKAHAWKACIPQGIQGSNPCLSATLFKSNYPQAKQISGSPGRYFIRVRHRCHVYAENLKALNSSKPSLLETSPLAPQQNPLFLDAQYLVARSSPQP